MSLFAAPGDEEYEPAPAAPRPPSPRRFRNPELAAQARVDAESKAEKCAPGSPPYTSYRAPRAATRLHVSVF